MHCLKEIDLELMQIAKSRKERTSVYGTSRRVSSEQSKVPGGRSDKRGGDRSWTSRIRYFSSCMNLSPSSHFENRIEGDLDILNYNLEEAVSPFEKPKVWFLVCRLWPASWMEGGRKSFASRGVVGENIKIRREIWVVCFFKIAGGRKFEASIKSHFLPKKYQQKRIQ